MSFLADKRKRKIFIIIASVVLTLANNAEDYEENKSNLPSDFTEYVIEGGCHAYFGMYGAQDGDGVPTITNEEQIRLTVENIVKLME